MAISDNNKSLMAYAKRVEMKPETIFFQEVCLDCAEYPDMCDGQDSDYCPRYARFLKGFQIDG